MNNIRLFLSDCDGVLTDAGMYYFESGDEAKKFNTRDGMAFKLLKEQNIKIGIITGEKSKIVKNRVKKLKMDYIIYMFNLEIFVLGYFIGGAFPVLRGVQRGCIVELYQNGCYDESLSLRLLR